MDKKSFEGEEEVRLCNYVDVYYNDRITADLDFMSATATQEQVKRFSLHKGDVLITKDSRFGLTGDAIRSAVFALPPTTTEQEVIANFLDRETSRIDALVAKKERLVELLLEKRSASISRLVTTGLDPNVSTKVRCRRRWRNPRNGARPVGKR